MRWAALFVYGALLMWLLVKGIARHRETWTPAEWRREALRLGAGLSLLLLGVGVLGLMGSSIARSWSEEAKVAGLLVFGLLLYNGIAVLVVEVSAFAGFEIARSRLPRVCGMISAIWVIVVGALFLYGAFTGRPAWFLQWHWWR